LKDSSNQSEDIFDNYDNCAKGGMSIDSRLTETGGAARGVSQEEGIKSNLPVCSYI
jgi:hypothetical protein